MAPCIFSYIQNYYRIKIISLEITEYYRNSKFGSVLISKQFESRYVR